MIIQRAVCSNVYSLDIQSCLYIKYIYIPSMKIAKKTKNAINAREETKTSGSNLFVIELLGKKRG